MNEKIILVTPPDDILLDGVRILLVDLTAEQNQIVSDALKAVNNQSTVVYVWNINQNIDWVLDKKQKSNIILFNAESEDQTLVGYLAAQSNSYYFGTLRTLGKVNNSAIYSTEQIIELMEDK